MPIVTAVVVSVTLVTAVVVSVALVTIVVKSVGGVAEHLLRDVVRQHQCVGWFAVVLVVDRGSQSPTVAVVTVAAKHWWTGEGGTVRCEPCRYALERVVVSVILCLEWEHKVLCFVVVDLPDSMYSDAEVFEWRIPV